MPLANRPIACELHLANKSLYSDTQDIGILQDVNEAAMLGCIEQLSLVSQFAAELFKGVLASADETTASVKRLRARTDAMLAEMSQVEARRSSDTTHFDFGELGTVRHPDMSSSQMFTAASRGDAVASQFNAITLDRDVRVRQEGEELPTRVPRFEKIDDVLREHHPEMLETKYGGTTRRQWSFPEYFEQKWIENESERIEARKKRRKDKKERKAKEQAVFAGTKTEGSTKTVTLQSWNANLEQEGAPKLGQVRRSSFSTLVSKQQSSATATAAQGGWKSSRTAYHSRKLIDDEPQEPVAASAVNPELEDKPVATTDIEPTERRPSPPSRPPPPPKPAPPAPTGSPAPDAAAPPEDGDVSAGWVPPLPPPKKRLVNREASSDGGATEVSSGPQAAAKVTARGFLAQIDGMNSSTLQLRSAGSQDQAGPDSPPAPAPPARSFLADIGGGAKSLRAVPTSEPDNAAPAKPQLSGFLADISSGAKSLRSTKAPEPRPVSAAPSNPLMAAIQGLDKSKLKKAQPIAKEPRSRGILDEIENMSKSKLKNASERRLSAAPEPAPVGLFGGSTIQDMLNKRRKDIEMSDTDSSEEEDEWD